MWDFLMRWETVWYLLLVLYVPSCVGLIVIVLLQKGKGVGFAGAFGMGGGSDTVFGPRSSKTLPQKLTYVMAAIFMLFALVMSLVAGRLGKGVAPEKLSEKAITANQSVDLTGLEDLGSGIKGEPAPAAPGAVPTAPPAAPATPAPPAAPDAPAAAAPPPPAPAPPSAPSAPAPAPSGS